jgi:hypothetical protein
MEKIVFSARLDQKRVPAHVRRLRQTGVLGGFWDFYAKNYSRPILSRLLDGVLFARLSTAKP